MTWLAFTSMIHWLYPAPVGFTLTSPVDPTLTILLATLPYQLTHLHSPWSLKTQQIQSNRLPSTNLGCLGECIDFSINFNVTDQSLRTLLRDDTIKIGVGPGRTQYSVHPGLLAQHSEYFKRALYGPWKEAEERVIKLDDVDCQTCK
jgi:hypothetical protein